MKKTISIGLAIFILACGLLIVLNNDTPEQVKTQTKSSEEITAPSPRSTSTTELIIGNKSAPITIIEYGDYKCPKCNEFHQQAGKDIRREWVDTGKAKIVYRPFPLFGEDSGLALYASFCAAEQGKFAAYHDKMFGYMWTNFLSKGDTDATVRTLFSPEKLGQLAGEAGLDAAQFSTCAAGRTHATAYNAAVDKAAGDSVQGTPTLIIGGQKIVGPQPYQIYRTLLEIQER
jgi:protein-disulfide isomerase